MADYNNRFDEVMIKLSQISDMIVAQKKSKTSSSSSKAMAEKVSFFTTLQ
jgi:hypothetical protein